MFASVSEMPLKIVCSTDCPKIGIFLLFLGPLAVTLSIILTVVHVSSGSSPTSPSAPPSPVAPSSHASDTFSVIITGTYETNDTRRRNLQEQQPLATPPVAPPAPPMPPPSPQSPDVSFYIPGMTTPSYYEVELVSMHACFDTLPQANFSFNASEACSNKTLLYEGLKRLVISDTGASLPNITTEHAVGMKAFMFTLTKKIRIQACYCEFCTSEETDVAAISEEGMTTLGRMENYTESGIISTYVSTLPVVNKRIDCGNYVCPHPNPIRVQSDNYPDSDHKVKAISSAADNSTFSVVVSVEGENQGNSNLMVEWHLDNSCIVYGTSSLGPLVAPSCDQDFILIEAYYPSMTGTWS